MAKLYYRYGAMGSSKTANAIMVQYNYNERGPKVLMVKPRLDTRDGERIVRSRCGLQAECRFMEDLDSISLEGIDCIIADEAHFFTTEQVEKALDTLRTTLLAAIKAGDRIRLQ